MHTRKVLALCSGVPRSVGDAHKCRTEGRIKEEMEPFEWLPGGEYQPCV